eukprot:gb/GFBE01054941.1/.p1 GENE.gb/GFBE01054941.1/~~gb/GFBE01054941.1/.p1  ORF type:complete len:289 (+),score=73.08 gb/GFBE01054941.1/:1-867(+)
MMLGAAMRSVGAQQPTPFAVQRALPQVRAAPRIIRSVPAPRGAASLVTATAAAALAARRLQKATGQATRRCAANLGGKFDVSSYYAAKPDAATKDWVMQQTMFRVKDPKRSLDFYTKVLGMSLITVGDFPQWGFTVYFVGYPPEKDLGPVPEDDAEKFAYCMRVPGCIELTWNHGSEVEDADRVYNTGNSDSTGSSDGEAVKGGFGHIGITVPDVYEACQRFKDMGAEFTKSPNSGGMKGLAFVKDPDGYLIEVLPLGKGFPFPTKEVDCNGVALEAGGGYVDKSKSS